MRISDWSSDVCSSDLPPAGSAGQRGRVAVGVPAMMPIILLKAHVKGYTKKDGRYVKPHETKAPGAKQKLKAPQLGLFGGKPSGVSHAKPAEPKGPPPGAQPHPQLDHHGETIHIHRPSKPTEPATWTDPKAAATFVPGGPVTAALPGVPFA